MKKKILIVLIIIVIVIIGFLILNFDVFKSNILDSYKVSDRVILVEKSYSNYAYGFVYNGSVICNNGSIYEFDFESSNILNENKLLKDKSNLILENVKNQKVRKVSKSDLKKINEYIDNLEDDIERENTAFDAGVNCIRAYNYNTEKIITLKEEGDYTGENKTEVSQKLLKIIEKYL